MKTNETPFYDMSDNPTGCCPRFKPEGWDRQSLHFENKRFVRAETHAADHVPTDMGPVFEKTYGAIVAAGASDDAHSLILSRDLSPTLSEHLFAVTKDVPGQDMVQLSGDFRMRVYEGAYETAPVWAEALDNELEGEGLDVEDQYFFYTTCPKCAEVYGKNYVVAVARVEPET